MDVPGGAGLRSVPAESNQRAWVSRGRLAAVACAVLMLLVGGRQAWARGPADGASPSALRGILSGDETVIEEWLQAPAVAPEEADREAAPADSVEESGQGPADDVPGVAVAALDADKRHGARAGAAARRTEKAHEGSTSLGYPAAGRLEGAVKIPAEGEGFALLGMVRGRETNWATEELAGLIARVGARLNEDFAGARLRVGNSGFESGGPIPWSVSHQCGRDVDLAFQVDDAKGHALTVSRFEHFDRRGRSRDDRRRAFSAARNWAIVEALITDEEVQVQWIFVAAWLKEKMLDYARESGVSDELIARAESVVSQPSDAADHSDHFHVRLYCSREDRLAGCHDYAPYWAWVDSYEKDVERHVRELAKQLTSPRPKVRKAALVNLRRVGARQTAAAAARLLHDPDADVRSEALRTVLALAAQRAPSMLTTALTDANRPGWALRVMRTLGNLPSPLPAKLLERVMADPARALRRLEKTSLDVLGELRVAAVAALGRAGRQQSAKKLIDALKDENASVREAAAEALPYVTNHDFGGRWGAKASEKRRARQTAKWESWLKKNLQDSWDQWRRQGFERKGFRFKRKMVSKQSIPILIRALERKEPYLRHNARMVLAKLVGEETAQHCNTSYRCWRRWWRKSYERFGHRRPGI